MTVPGSPSARCGVHDMAWETIDGEHSRSPGLSARESPESQPNRNCVDRPIVPNTYGKCRCSEVAGYGSAMPGRSGSGELTRL